MPPDSHLDERTLEILQLLWQHGPQKPAELQRRFSHRMKNPALRWLLNDLVARGKLRRQRQGKAFVYHAAVERRALLASLGRRLRDLLFGGSALAMIGELSDLEKVSAEDIAHLRRVARKTPARGRALERRKRGR